MTRFESRATDLARQILALLDLHASTDGAQGCEDVEDAIAAIADGESKTADLAQALLDIEATRAEDIAEDEGGAWLDACHAAGLLDVAPDAVLGDDECATGCIYWSGFGAEASIRRAVAS